MTSAPCARGPPFPRRRHPWRPAEIWLCCRQRGTTPTHSVPLSEPTSLTTCTGYKYSFKIYPCRVFSKHRRRHRDLRDPPPPPYSGKSKSSSPRSIWPSRSYLDVHLVCDNLATHKTPAVDDGLAKPTRFHLHFTPTGLSWISQVERWIGFLTDQLLRRGVHESVQSPEKTSTPGSKPGTRTQTLRLEENRRRNPRFPRKICLTDFRRGTLAACIAVHGVGAGRLFQTVRPGRGAFRMPGRAA